MCVHFLVSRNARKSKSCQIIKFAKLVKAKEEETFRFFKQTKFTNSMYKTWFDNHDDGAWPIGKQPKIPGIQKSK